MTSWYWSRSTPQPASGDFARAYVPVRIQGTAPDGSLDTFAQILLPEAAGVTYGAVVGALDFVPYDEANPAGYITTSGARSAVSAASSGGLSYDPTAGAFKLANTGALTFLANSSNGSATPAAVSVTTARQMLLLDQVDNKSAATIKSELLSAANTFTTVQTVKPATTTPSGGVRLSGDSDSGYVETLMPDGSRGGYMGYFPSPTSPMTFGNDLGTGYSFPNGPMSSGSDPSSGAHLVRLSWLQGAAGAQNLGYQHPSTGGGLRTYYARAREDMRVTDFYSGVSSGNMPQARTNFLSFDDTPYFQAAINACRNLGITRLRIPSSFYRIASDGTGLDINCAVDLFGDSHIESGAFGGSPITGGAGEAAIGTWVKCQPANGAQGIVLGSGAARGARFRDFAITQDHPQPTSGWAPNNYDYVFRAENTLGSAVFDVPLIGVNKGISIFYCGRVDIPHLKGQCFNTALRVDKMYDALDIGVVHLWTYWTSDSRVINYQQNNLYAINMGRCDGGKAGRALILGANRGLNVSDFGYGTTTDFRYSVFQAEEAKYGLVVDAQAQNLTFGFFKAQGQDYTNNSIAIPGSIGVWATTNANGGRINLGTAKIERQAMNGIRNESNMAIRCAELAASAWTSGSGALWYSPTTPIECYGNLIYEPAVPRGVTGEMRVPVYQNF